MDLSLRGQINDRFTKAIEQLGAVNQDGKKKLELRLGGIYALEQIAKESSDHHWPIMEVLTAYVREHAPQKEEEQLSQAEISSRKTEFLGDSQSLPKPAPDIQAILTVLGGRTRIFGKGEDQFLGLAGTVLQGANLSGAHLEGALLWNADLQGANLTGAHLQWARLWGADLQRALVEGAHLQRARLWGADLQGVDLTGAHLEGATGLTVEQLSTVKTLSQAHLDPPLQEQIQQQYPSLLRPV